jgi:DNA-directed RNA polymerase subunit RPC12/RpoP
MQELKCARCGADLETWNVENEGLYGRCTHCRTTYLIDDVERSHVTVDVRLPKGSTVPAKPVLSRRAAILGVGTVSAIAAGALFGPRLLLPASGDQPKSPAVKALWNIGGKGPGPGQFRNYISNVTIDGQGRSAISIASSPLIQLFDGDGRFLARWVAGSASPRLLAALPGGDLILDGSDGFERRDPLSGRLLAIIPEDKTLPSLSADRGATTPDGGFAIYHAGRSIFTSGQRNAVPDDRIAYFSADGSLIGVIGPLIGKVFRPDPAVPELPEASALAIDGAGTIYLLFHKKEDFDTREGLYAFNPDGVFLRKIELDQKFYGMVAATADGTLYHADPWTPVITRIKGTERSSIDLSALEDDTKAGTGMPFEIAAFPNGDLGVGTGSYRYLRIHWPEPS